MNAANNGHNQLHVVFGTGPLGRATINGLLKRGVRVRAVNRSGQMPEAPAGVELVKADAYNPAEVRRVAEGAVGVYQAAQPGYTEWAEKFPPLQASIVEGVSAVGANLVVGENLYMYGEVDGTMTESTPYRAHTKKGKVRQAMTEALEQAHASGKLKVAVARASDFYGPFVLDSSVAGDRVVYPALAGKSASLVGNLDKPHTMTYIEDFGEAMAILGTTDKGFGQAWHVPNANPTITQRQFITMFYQCVGTEPKMSAMGAFMLRIGGLFIPEAKEVIEMLYEFNEPHIVDSSKFEKAFGMKPTPIEEGIRRTVEWYRAHPNAH
jgi:nucleoside-diphosphate-sugar epimerase